MSAALQLAPPSPVDSLTLVEELVATPEALDRRCTHRRDALSVLPRLLGLSLLAFGSFAVAQSALNRLAATPLHDSALVEATVLFLGYAGGVVGAMAASLPACYVGSALAGIEQPPWRLAVEYVRALAASSLWLLGVLPLYGGAALALHQLLPTTVIASWELPATAAVVYAGFGLPFAAGIVGRRSLLRSLEQLEGPDSRGQGRVLVAGATALLAILSAGGASRIVWELGSRL